MNSSSASGVLFLTVIAGLVLTNGACGSPRQYHPLPDAGDGSSGGAGGVSGVAVDAAATGGTVGGGGAAGGQDAAIGDAPVGGPNDLVAPCAAGQKRCDGFCVALNDPKYGCDTATCDVSGCPDIPGGTLVCQGASCVVGTCGQGTKKCADRCVDANDPAYGCGPSTCDASTCPGPGAGGSVICQGGVCVIGSCGAGTKKCGTRCVAVTDPTYG